MRGIRRLGCVYESDAYDHVKCVCVFGRPDVPMCHQHQPRLAHTLIHTLTNLAQTRPNVRRLANKSGVLTAVYSRSYATHVLKRCVWRRRVERAVI